MCQNFEAKPFQLLVNKKRSFVFLCQGDEDILLLSWIVNCEKFAMSHQMIMKVVMVTMVIATMMLVMLEMMITTMILVTMMLVTMTRR